MENPVESDGKVDPAELDSVEYRERFEKTRAGVEALDDAADNVVFE